MLEKLNSIVYDEEKGYVRKCITSNSEAKAEKTCLELLSQHDSDSGGDVLHVPKWYAEESTEYTVCMEYIRGIRVYDLLAVLNRFVRIHPDKGVVSRSYALKQNLIGIAIRTIARFQSPELQDALTNADGTSVAPYDYRSKLMEAVDYLRVCTGASAKGLLLDEIEHVANYLSQRVEVAFRDATLKNFIIRLPASDEKFRDYRDIIESTNGYIRPTNWQWGDERAAIEILELLSGVEELADQVYSVDFESTHALTNRQDDYLHLFTLEVVGVSYEVARQFLDRHVGVDEEELNYAILFRCLRDGTRRLFYKCERPSIFATRYYHETTEHLLLVALEALERLRANSSHADFLSELHSVLVRFRISQAPWPWQLNAPLQEWATEEVAERAPLAHKECKSTASE